VRGRRERASEEKDGEEGERSSEEDGEEGGREVVRRWMERN
jgi:hypothetical protein